MKINLHTKYENEVHKSRTEIRIAGAEDAEAIVKVLAKSFVEYEPFYTPQAYRATVPPVDEIKSRFVDKSSVIWVVADDNRIVGTVSVIPKQDALYIRSMAILPEIRGNQIGEKFLKAIEDYAVANNYRKLTLNTTPFLNRAVRLYEKFGFVQKGTDDLFGTPLWKMEKYLAPVNDRKRGEYLISDNRFAAAKARAKKCLKKNF